jgi:hypothetical protein
MLLSFLITVGQVWGGDLTGYQYQHQNGMPGSLSNTRPVTMVNMRVMLW